MLMESACAVSDDTSWGVDALHDVVHVGVSPQGSVDAVRACGVAAGIASDALNVVTEEPMHFEQATCLVDACTSGERPTRS